MLEWIKKYSGLIPVFVLGVALIAVYKTFDSFDSLINGIKNIFSAATPFFIAFVIAYMLNIPAKSVNILLLKKCRLRFVQKLSHAISILVVYVVFIAAIIIVLSAILPAMYRNIFDLYQNLPQFASSVTNYVGNLDLLKKLNIDISSFVSSIDVTELFNQIFDMNAIGKYAEGLANFTSGLLSIFIAIIASIYMLIEKKKIIAMIHRIIKIFAKNDTGEKFLDSCANINNIFTQYIYSRLICCIVMAIATTIMLLVFKDRYAVLLGIFVGFMDLIPYFGSIISWVVSVIVMIITGGPLHALWCGIMMLIMQQLDGNVLAPKVMGDRLEISPLLIIIAVTVGGSLFGFIGMLISVPVVAVLRVIVAQFLDSREHAKLTK